MIPLQPLVSAEWLFSNRNLPNLVLLDASLKKPGAETEEKVEPRHIPGSLFFDLENNFSDPKSPFPHMMPSAEIFTEEAQKMGINKNSTIVVYDTFGIYSSPRVWWMFRAMGHHEVYVLNGGLPEWINAGFETSVSYAQPKGKGDFVAKPEGKWFSDKKEVFSALHDNGKRVVDARSRERFSGEAEEPRLGLRRGHIPGSINIPFQEVLDGNKFPEAETLEHYLAPLIPKEKQLIFSCGSGVTACIDALAAVMAGYTNLSIYDGSWSEWGALSELPIEGPV